jgi:hypothetical protein
MSENEQYVAQHAAEPKPLLSNDMYDRLKAFTTMVMPALGALYFGLAKIWGLPKGEEVVGSLAIIATFLGVLLLWSTRRYNMSDDRFDGEINITEHENGLKTGAINLKNYENPADIVQQDQVVFKVNKQ